MQWSKVSTSRVPLYDIHIGIQALQSTNMSLTSDSYHYMQTYIVNVISHTLHKHSIHTMQQAK